MEDFEKFIIEHDGDDISRLLLSTKKWPELSDDRLAAFDSGKLLVNTLEARKKLRKKAPSWHGCTSLIYPSSLCAEQCSSEATAEYKASLAVRILNEYPSAAPAGFAGAGMQAAGRIADLTGGLGVDDYALSKVSSEVLYNEMNSELAAAAEHNFECLGARNIRYSCREVVPGGLKEVLGDFRPDLIFMDPARRSSEGRKVFMLKDCSPNVLDLLPEIFRTCSHLLLKLSPMADISLLVSQLNEACPVASVREVHVVASEGECKELLVRMDRDWSGGWSLTCCENGKTLEFLPEEIGSGSQTLVSDLSEVKRIFEPGKSLTKAGLFSAVCDRFALRKLGSFTHLYAVPVDGAISYTPVELEDFGKIFDVIEIHPLCKASLKDVGRRFPHSEVTARNIPMSSDELRARLKVKSGDMAHIFGVRIDLPAGPENYLLVTQ